MRDYEPIEYEYTLFTYKELRSYVNQQWKDMSEDERAMRQKEANPTYAEYVLGILRKGESVQMDDHLYDYKIIPPHDRIGSPDMIEGGHD